MARLIHRLFALALIGLAAASGSGPTRASPPPLPGGVTTSPFDALLPFSTPYPVEGLVGNVGHRGTFSRSAALITSSGLTEAVIDPEREWVTGVPAKTPAFSLETHDIYPSDAVGPLANGANGFAATFWVRFPARAPVPPATLPPRVEGYLLGAVNVDPAYRGPDYGLAVDVFNGTLNVQPQGLHGPVLTTSDAHVLRADGVWRHVALTVQRLCDGACTAAGDSDVPAVLRLYLDGDLVLAADVKVQAVVNQVELGTIITGFEDYAYADGAYELDDVFIYDRALSLSEIQSLRRLVDAGLVGQWPPVSPRESPDAYPHTDTLSRTDGLVADFPASSFTADTKLITVAQGDAIGHGASTALAWMKLRGNGPATFAFQVFRQDRPIAAEVALLPAGSFTDVEIGCNGTRKHVVQLWTDWYLYAIVRDADDRLTLYIDGVAYPFECTVRDSEGFGEYLIANGELSGELGTSNHVDIAWAAVYRKALAVDAQMAIGRPGPYAWTDLELDRDQQPRDFAQRAGMSWNLGVPSMPLIFRPERNADFVPTGVAIGTQGALEKARASTGPNAEAPLGPFTLALTFEMRRNFGGDARWISLVRRGYSSDPERVWDVGIDVRCEANHCTHFDIAVPDVTDPTKEQSFLVKHDFFYNQPVTLVVAWPHTVYVAQPDLQPGEAAPPLAEHRPRVAVNGVEHGASDAGLAIVTTADGIARGATPTASDYLGWYIGAFGDHPAGQFELRYDEIRLYGYALPDVAHVAAHCAGPNACGDQLERCVGRAGQGGDAVGSVSCAGCLDSAYAVARAGQDADFEPIACEARRGFFEACVSNDQCASGVCAEGACRTRDPIECGPVCLAAGRWCAPMETPGGTEYFCGDCASGFERIPTHQSLSAADRRLRCAWAPFKEAETPCAGDAECLSGHCVTRTSVSPTVSAVRSDWTRDYRDSVDCGAYSRSSDAACSLSGQDVKASAPVSALTEHVCAARAPAECRDLGRDAILTPEEVLPNGLSGSAYACAQDARVCRQNFVPAWEVLSPSACQEAWTKAFSYTIEGHCDTIDGADCFGLDTSNGSHPSLHYPAWRDSFVRGTDVDLGLLAQIFLGKSPGDRLTLADVSALEQKGVGRLLIDYLANPAARTTLEAQYGKFLPLGSCARDAHDVGNAAVEDRAYYKANRLSCVPDRRPNGSVCPPPAEHGDGHAFCQSRYCARDTKLCEDGTNPLLEIRGNAQNDENSGAQGVKFGIIRCDDTSVEVEENQVTNDPLDDDFRFHADLSQSWNLCMFGRRFPPVPLFEVDFEVDRTQGADCADNNVKSYLIGIPLSSPPPGPLIGSCQGLTVDADEICLPPEPGCELVDPTNISLSSLAQSLVPSPRLCVPLPEDVEESLEYEKTFMAGVVPVTVGVGITLDLCLESYLGMGETGLPKLELKPVASAGAQAMAGIGVEEAEFKAWAGAALELTFASISIPIGWGFYVDIEIAPGPNGDPKPVLKIGIGERIALELEYLSGAFGLFAEVAFGPFGFEWAVELFAWSGITVTQTLSDRSLWETDVDFQFDPGLSLPNGGTSSVCSGRCQ